MTREEVDDLLVDTERGFRRARRDVYALLGVSTSITLAMAVVGVIGGIGALPALLVGVSAIIAALIRFADDPAHVQEALDSDPAEVVELRLARRGVIIRTHRKSALCNVRNPAELLVRLGQRCPDAVVRRVGHLRY